MTQYKFITIPRTYIIKKILLLLIISIGVFFVFWQFSLLPNGIDGDVIVASANSLHLFEKYNFVDIFVNSPTSPNPLAYQYWNMPLNTILVALFNIITQNPITGPILATSMVGILNIYLFWTLSKQVLNVKASYFALFFFCTSTFHLLFVRSGFVQNTLVVSFVISSILFLLLAIKKDSKYLLPLGIVSGINLFNGYPVSYVTFIVIFIFLLSERKWRIFFSKKLIFCVFIGLITLVTLSALFSILNNESDILLAFKESTHHFLFTRYRETHANTNIFKNILSGIKILFLGYGRSYQFAVFRIFDHALFNPVIGFCTIVGIITSFKRRSSIDKLLLMWFFSVFILSSVVNYPEERYFLALLPIPYIYSGEIISKLFHKKYLFPLIPIFALLYMYQFTYKPYFVIYASNNGNLSGGLKDNEISQYLLQNYNPEKTILISGNDSDIKLYGIELGTKFKYGSIISWKNFILNKQNYLNKEAIIIIPTNPNYIMENGKLLKLAQDDLNKIISDNKNVNIQKTKIISDYLNRPIYELYSVSFNTQ